MTQQHALVKHFQVLVICPICAAAVPESLTEEHRGWHQSLQLPPAKPKPKAKTR